MKHLTSQLGLEQHKLEYYTRLMNELRAENMHAACFSVKMQKITAAHCPFLIDEIIGKYN